MTDEEIKALYENMPLMGDGECLIERMRNKLTPAMTMAEIIKNDFPVEIPEDFKRDCEAQFIESMRHVKAIMDAM